MGYVYILSNPSMPDLIKIGSTDRSPDERIAELSTPTGVPTPFCLEFSVYFIYHFKAELDIHEELDSHRISGSREFFRIPVEDAKRVILTQRLVELVNHLSGWDDRQVGQLIHSILIKRPLIHFDVTKEIILSWNCENLIELVDVIFSGHPAVFRKFRKFSHED